MFHERALKICYMKTFEVMEKNSVSKGSGEKIGLLDRVSITKDNFMNLQAFQDVAIKADPDNAVATETQKQRASLDNMIFNFKNPEGTLIWQEFACDYSELVQTVGDVNVFKGTYIGCPIAVKRYEISGLDENWQEHLKLVKRLTDPSLFLIFGISEDHPQNHLNLMTEYCTKTLSEWVREERVRGIEVMCNISSQIAKGMRYLEEHNVLHLNLTPNNILLSPMLNPKISDFDYKLLKGSKFNAVERCSHEYAAPEVFSGSHDVNHAADVYSFAMVAYFVFLGQDVLAHVEHKDGIVDLTDLHRKLNDALLHHEHFNPEEKLTTERQNLSNRNEKVCTELIGDVYSENPTLSVLAKSLEKNVQHRTSTFTSFFFRRPKKENKESNTYTKKENDEPSTPKKENDETSTELSIFDKILEEYRVTEKELSILTNIFDQKNSEKMEFNTLLGKLKAKLFVEEKPKVLVEGEKPEPPVNELLQPDNIYRKYLYLKLGDGSNLSIDENYYTPDKKLMVHKDKFLTFINLHGPTLLEYKAKNAPNPFDCLFNDLVSKKWYWENTSNSYTSNYLKKHAEKSKSKEKKNFFLIRDGVHKPDTYTLEVCLSVTGFVQKISLKDIYSCNNYAKQLEELGYVCLEKSDNCDYGDRINRTYDDVFKKSKVDKNQKRNKKRKQAQENILGGGKKDTNEDG